MNVWLSFVDPDREEFIGVIITNTTDNYLPLALEAIHEYGLPDKVENVELMKAVVKTHQMRINPGGELRALEITDKLWSKIPADYKDILLKRESLDELYTILGWINESNPASTSL